MMFLVAVLVGMIDPITALGGIATGYIAHRGSPLAIIPFGLALALIVTLQVASGAGSAYFVISQTCAVALWAGLTFASIRAVKSFNPPPKP